MQKEHSKPQRLVYTEPHDVERLIHDIVTSYIAIQKDREITNEKMSSNPVTVSYFGIDQKFPNEDKSLFRYEWFDKVPTEIKDIARRIIKNFYEKDKMVSRAA